MKDKSSTPLSAEDLKVGDIFTIRSWETNPDPIGSGGLQASRAKNHAFEGEVLKCSAISLPFITVKILSGSSITIVSLDTRYMTLARLTGGYMIEMLAPGKRAKERSKGFLSRLFNR